MIFLNDLKFFIPELFLTISLLMMVAYSVISVNNNTLITFRNSIAENVMFAILILIITVILFILQPSANFIFFEFQLVTSSFTYFFKLFILTISIGVLIFSYNYFKWELVGVVEIPFLIVSALLGMFLIINSNDFIALYMGMELQSLSFYVLTTSKKYSNLSTEAGLKYFILGSLASAFLLFGISIFYGYAGTTNFSDLTSLLINDIPVEISTGVYLGMLFVITGLLFKLPAAPLHNWAPDVYDGASSIVTAFFALVPKIAIVTLLIRIFYINFFTLLHYWSLLLVIFGTISLVIGCFGALYQTRIKRFIAYSAINHVGFILLSISTGTTEGIFAASFYIIVYTIMNLAIFACILSIRRTFGIKMILLEEFFALYKSYPIIGIGVTVIFFSMAGIPPLIGFFSKFYVINALVKSSMYLPAIIAVLVSVISCVYYIRIIKNMFFLDKTYHWKNIHHISYESSFLFSFSVLLVIILPFFLNFFILAIYNMALHIMLL